MCGTTKFLLLFGLVSFSTQEEPCQTPSGKPGNCIKLEQCAEIFSVVTSSDSPSRFEFLKSYHCGFDGSDPKVCCLQRNQEEFDGNSLSSFERVRIPKLAENLKKNDSELKNLNVDIAKSSAKSEVVKDNVNWIMKDQMEHKNSFENHGFETESRSAFFTTPVNATQFSKVSLTDCGIDQSNRIYGGSIADMDEFPWMAVLEFSTPDGVRLGCGGLLIGPQYVVTAAHCLRGGSGMPRSWRLRSVRLGEYNLRTDPDCLPDGEEGLECAPSPLSYGIEWALAHERFRPSDQSQRHDVGLIKLARPAALGPYVRPICLPRGPELQPRLLVAGWGRTTDPVISAGLGRGRPGAVPSGSSSAAQLLKLRIPLVDKQLCDRAYAGKGIILGPSQICAGGEHGKDTCTGDSGGPLMQRDSSTARWHAVGIVSFGPTRCGSSDWPGVYTKLYDYLPWLMNKLQASV